mmetsp:Transcript_4650/g.6729  ORF Transcript_4650/g.6729 Transcript_4650/m.6729 type:complete len:360 (-) Transcript_4650:1730-2809(-)|eukprot:CAMPEP_0194214932 /NCGR_PEP_ID=MMETSP0156-20130528/16369_1 /TAXON_ID=33649 /ORGANISM="Thalassionema nitzschioides, Strain L26-B" /LENGTH=359 /DNA_ID=CAMNT_0038943309 /DNA_START=111 /DNA_END=1190 /DNA_ORIENTATION=+
MVAADPSLYVLALNQKFDDILESLDNDDYASSLDWIDKQGNTLLHILCRQNNLPSRLVKLVIERRPGMVAQRNYTSWTPLHLAFDSRRNLKNRPGKSRSYRTNGDGESTNNILLQLIQACPRAVSIPRESGFARETPFHIACEAQVEIQILEAMLKIDPTLAITELHTGINRLFRDKLYEHVNLILLTAWAGKLTSEKAFLLHATCVQCIPREYFMKILNEYKQFATLLKDSNGNTPLHLAAIQKPSRVAPAHLQFIINSLLDADSRAADQINGEGRYPLHCALDNPHVPWITSTPHFGTTCLSRALLGSSKQALLCTRDAITCLYPFQLSATHAHRSRLHLTTTFEILRAAPEVLLFH